MIELMMFSVHDSKAGHFNRPMFFVAAGEAIRAFQVECETQDSMLKRFPGDYRLFRVGKFDQVSGKVVPEVPVEICSALEFSNKEG